MVKAVTREQVVTIKAPSTRLVNTNVKAPVIILKLVESEAQDLLQALAGNEGDTAVAISAVLTAELAVPAE